ncbi:MAG: hypothetical protein N4A72_20635 [Bacteroidales bacterium]|jgi:hypothetical protein|nr:hypothetical protein [Bacteroidales bacterium]
MKLERILDKVNSLEKNSFLKIIDNIITSSPCNAKEIDKILSENNNDLKSADNINISKVFSLVTKEFSDIIKAEFLNITSQIDILIDIISRDGNAIINRDWFAYLYEKELASITKKTKQLAKEIESDRSSIDKERIRDYNIYMACVKKAYTNDIENNREEKITDDELSILLTLAAKLELSQEEVKLINYLIIPPNKLNIDSIINLLRNIGLIFYSRKNNELYIPDEIVRLLRYVRDKEIADKYYRRILKSFREPQLNQICRKHNINIKELNYEGKIKRIINDGISISNLLSYDIHKEGTSQSDKKRYLNDIWENNLKIDVTLKGATLDDKVKNMIKYFDTIEQDDKVGISVDGYDKMLRELYDTIPDMKKRIQSQFEMQDDNSLDSQSLLDYNIKPRDILDLIPSDALKRFITTKEIKSRGDLIINTLDAYKDADNLYIENYEFIGYRDIVGLKSNGLHIKESELGLKFEDITRTIFSKLGFNVDEKLKKEINNNKNKIDLLLNLGNNNLIIIECKTSKDSGYNKFSSVSRQIKAYTEMAKERGYNVVKSLLIAPDFSDDFVYDCELEFEINISLISAASLIKILDGFKNSRHNQLPYQLLMKDVLIKEDRILKAINK